MLEERNTAENLWSVLEFRDLEDETKGPLMSGTNSCTSLTCSINEPCATNAYCPTTIGCRPGPSMGRKR